MDEQTRADRRSYWLWCRDENLNYAVELIDAAAAYRRQGNLFNAESNERIAQSNLETAEHYEQYAIDARPYYE